MRYATRTTLTALAAIALVGGIFASSADRAPAAHAETGTSTETPTPADTSTPSPTTSETPTPTPAPETAPNETTQASPSTTDDNPDLDEMDATGNHSMGSTIRQNDPDFAVQAQGDDSMQTFAATGNIPPGVPGLDVSGWQVLNAASWRTIWANGARFAYVKATESTDYTSSQFAEQYNDSYAAGLIRGAYHFASPDTSSGAAQANFFVNNGGGWSNDGRTLPPLLDIEYNTHGPTCYGLSQAAMVSWIADFTNTVKARTGRAAAIYTTTDWWTRCTGNNGGFSSNPLFIARYPNNIASGAGTLPNGWSKYTIWQFTDATYSNGQAGLFPGDQDVFNGSLAELQAFARGSSTMAAAYQSPIINVQDFNGDGKADFVGRKSDGSLWFYAGTGVVNSSNQGYKAAVKIGIGWNGFDTIIGVGDFNGDGKADVVARTPAGGLWLYPGNGAGRFQASKQIGNGWSMFDIIIGVGDFNGDGKSDIIGRAAGGVLWLYPGNGAGGFLAAKQIGISWNAFTTIVSAGDFNSDRKPDLVARMPDGGLWLYPGNGKGGFGASGQIGVGWQVFDSIVGVGDFNGDKKTDLIGHKANGDMSLYPGDGGTGFLQPATIGTGWGIFTTLYGSPDFNGDGKSDIIGRKPDGTLWLYANAGSTDSLNSGHQPAIQIGNGWNTFNTIVSPDDFSGDKKADLIARKPNGTLWLYAGNGSGGFSAISQIGNGWNIFDTIIGTGDFNGDKKADLIARKPNGTLWLYAGNGSGGFSTVSQIGVGWEIFDTIIGAGDFNGDNKADLIGRKPDGTLWLYAGNGLGGFQAASQIGHGWQAFDAITNVTDFNGDTGASLIAHRPDGTLRLYPGNGAGRFQAATDIGRTG